MCKTPTTTIDFEDGCYGSMWFHQEQTKIIQGPAPDDDDDESLLEMKAFYVRFSMNDDDVDEQRKLIPPSITLVYLPRQTQTQTQTHTHMMMSSSSSSSLQINGSIIRPESTAFVTLHRLPLNDDEVVFCSRDVIRVSQGVEFQVYVREHQVFKGSLRSRSRSSSWQLECKCELDMIMSQQAVLLGLPLISDAMLCLQLTSNNCVAPIITTCRVDMRRRGRRHQRRYYYCTGKVVQQQQQQLQLEEIPEESELDLSFYHDHHHQHPTTTTTSPSPSNSSEDDDDAVEMELEGVRWAVDLGIWVLCLGLGYFVSKASSKPKFGFRSRHPSPTIF
ncbi:hypothetical protein Sjap_021197 [Stephania japonica]|uniref:Uncharacterized protein n=1 Tax=Stephania japonica TaxID=461633 RepID=A0AAP0F9I3_9MAGN